MTVPVRVSRFRPWNYITGESRSSVVCERLLRVSPPRAPSSSWTNLDRSLFVSLSARVPERDSSVVEEIGIGRVFSAKGGGAGNERVPATATGGVEPGRVPFNPLLIAFAMASP